MDIRVTPDGGFTVLLRTPWDGPWRRFSQPFAIVYTSDVADVRRCLAEVDEQVRTRGCFAAGFVCYEAAAAFGLPARAGAAEALPLVCFGLFEPSDVTALPRLPQATSHRVGEWQPDIDRAAYNEAIGRIKAWIEAGDTYQINFTFRLSASFEGDPLSLFTALVDAQAGAWAAYVDVGTHAIGSASPELFFTFEDGRLECRPMKGTAARGLFPEADRRQAATLRQSEKNRAENVMVLDVVRNDLGRIAKIGSVSVQSLFAVEPFPAHWQMTSTVAAELADDGGPVLSRIFESLFPSPSVTGAPKHRSMEIIRQLERTPRGIYTGAIGYVTPDRRAQFNVAIRTVTVDRSRRSAEFGVGSGVVWDSTDRAEYDECLLKAAILTPHASGRMPQPGEFKLLETIRWTEEEGFFLLERHLQRLQESACYFGFPLDLAAVRSRLAASVHGRTAPARIRLLTSGHGRIDVQVADLVSTGEVLTAALAAGPIDTRDVFLYHKTTRRAVYESAQSARPDVDVVLLWNAAGEITEATVFNIVVEVGGRKVTPLVDCGLLPGTLRAELLATGEIEERRVLVSELQDATRVWGINSVAGWRRLKLVV